MLIPKIILRKRNILSGFLVIFTVVVVIRKNAIRLVEVEPRVHDVTFILPSKKSVQNDADFAARFGRRRETRNASANISLFDFYERQGLKVITAHNASLLALISANETEKVMNILDSKNLRNEHNPSITFQYPIVNLKHPNFINAEDKRRFLANADNLEQANTYVQYPQQLQGRIELIHNGLADERFDCGWKAPLDKWREQNDGSVKVEVNDRLVVPLVVTDGWAFQHFMDGVFPKLAAFSPFLGNKNISYLAFLPTDDIVSEILERLGISKSQIIPYSIGKVALKYQLNICVTPPMHPTLWGQMRNLLGVNTHLDEPYRNGIVILLTRAKSINPGRSMTNYDDVVSVLRSRYKDKLIVFQGGYNLTESLSLFGAARIIIGVHGGAFYNLNFSPKETVIVEYLAVSKTGEVIGLRHLAPIAWLMSQMVGQQYYRVIEDPVGMDGDLQVNLDKLVKLLDQIDSS